MKKILLTTLSLLCAVTLFAQKRATVTATLIDSETQEGVPGAVLAFAPADSTKQTQYTTSGFQGAVSMPLPYGDYTLSISFLGYNEHRQAVKLDKPKVELGTIALRPGVQIETVVKEVQALRTSQKGDTVTYNASAFKVASDADVEGLLKKMPGITVNDGAVEAQGEEIKKIFIDGKEFFGDDVTTAIKSLPAEAVKSIEVYNKLSDAAEFSGMDDGEGYKALNIVTYETMRQGQFGKFYAGYGYDADTKTESHHKYLAGTNVNLFQGDSRVTVLGLFNNINQQNFSFEDILEVSGGGGGRGGVGQYMMRPQSGVARVNALGLNYSDTWGKRDQLTFQGSYFFNNTNTVNRSTTDRWYETPYVDTMTTRGYSDTRGMNHRFNARFEWKISDNQSLMVRPSFSYQSNDPYSTTLGWQYGATDANGRGYSRIDNLNDGLRHGYNVGGNVTYRAKLGKDGRTVTLDGQMRYSDRSNSSNSASNLLGYLDERPAWADAAEGEPWGWDPAGYTRMRYLRSLTPSNTLSMRGELTYTEPVAKNANISLQYRVTYNSQERNRQSYITDELFGIDGLTPDPSLSNRYESDYLTQRIGPGFRYSKERNTFVANVFYQRSSLEGQVVSGNSDRISHTYNDVTYFMMGQLNINRANQLRLFVTSYTQNPGVTQLQNIFDISNAQYISSGNPELNPSYNHTVNFHYTNSNVEKGRTFMWMFSFNAAQDYITTQVLYDGTVDIPGGEQGYSYLQYSRPVNMDGQWSLRTHLSYGLPLNFIKSNFNIMAGINYSLTPGMINQTRNDTQNMGYDFRAVLGSNISENVDFTLSWNGTYNEATNSSDASQSKNRYFNHSARGDLKVVLPLGFTITASAAYSQYIGFTNDYDESYLLCNAFIGKKLFKNKRGEISIGVNDLLNQNKAFSRSIGSGWTQNVTNSVIGRYYMLNFTYNLRHFGKKGSTNLSDYGIGEGARMMGPGGPGGPPMR